MVALAQSDDAEDQTQDQVEAQEEDAMELEAVTVTGGFIGSLSTSRALKMDEDAIVEAVSAEDIGKLPDVSITESLARLPGLTAQRLNGRGQVISVRGLAPDFTTALLNGRQQVSTGDNRGVEFDQYPAELINQAVVYKTPNAKLIGQGLAGTVDLRTIRPLDHGRTTFAANLRYEWNQIDALNAGSDDDGRRFSLSYVTQNQDNTVGIALGFAHQKTPTQGERFNAWGYPQTGDGELIIGGAKPFVQSVELERNGFVGVLEFEPNERFETAIDLYYSEFEEDQQLRGIEFPLFWSAAQLQPGYTVENGLVTNGQFNDVKGVMRNDLNARDADLFSAGWNATYKFNEQWTGEIDINHSRVDRVDTLLETYSGTGPAGVGATDNLGFMMTDRGAVFSSIIDYTDPNLIMLTSPQGWGGDIIPGGQLGYLNMPSIDDELTQFQVGATRFLNGGISNVDFGINYSTREKSLVADEFFLALADGSNAAPIPAGAITGITDLSFLGIPGMISYDPRALINMGIYDLRRNPNSDVVIKSWEVEEDVTLGYLQFGVDSFWGNVPVYGNFGVQVVHTDQGSTGQAASGTGDGVQALPIAGGKDYTDFLPSATLSFEFANQKYLRVGVARTLARPRMDQMRASQQWSFDASKVDETDINNSPWGGSGGNPELDPWVANSFDVSFEKYFADDTGYVSVAGFFKDLDTYVYDRIAVADFTGYPTGGLDPVLDQGLVTTPQNGEGGEIYGIELAASVTGQMLTPALTGWGIIANASFTESEIQPDENNPATPIPGLSEDVINFTLYYERNGFSGRVSNRYRSDFLGEVAGFGNGRTLRFVESESLVDAQIGYAFQPGSRLDGWSVYLQGYNLTDEPFRTYNEGDRRQIIDYQRYGRTYAVGIAYRFD